MALKQILFPIGRLIIVQYTNSVLGPFFFGKMPYSKLTSSRLVLKVYTIFLRYSIFLRQKLSPYYLINVGEYMFNLFHHSFQYTRLSNIFTMQSDYHTSLSANILFQLLKRFTRDVQLIIGSSKFCLKYKYTAI